MRYILIAIWVIGCGGGTSGTTSTDLRNISGIVLDLSGEPITNAPMYMETDSSEVSSSTDEDGEFAITVGADSREIFYTIEVNQKSVPGEVTATLKGESVMRVGIFLNDLTLTSSNILSEVVIDLVSCPGIKFKDGRLIGRPTSSECKVSVTQATDYSPLKTSPVVLASKCQSKVIPVDSHGKTEVFSIFDALECGEFELRMFNSDRLLGITVNLAD